MTTEQTNKQDLLLDVGATCHIPMKIRDKAIVFRCSHVWTGSSVISNVEQTMPTIFIGIIDETYPESLWNDHLDRFKKLFTICDNTFMELKLCPSRKDGGRVDHFKLSADVAKALDMLNQTSNLCGLRFVRLGTSSSPAMEEASESLIRGWDVSFDKKCVQFVSLGDSDDSQWLKFTYSLCIRQVCFELQFFNTNDYNIHGFLEFNNQKKEIAKQIKKALIQAMNDQAQKAPN